MQKIKFTGLIFAGATFGTALSGCSDVTMNTVVSAKGNNKLYLTDITDLNAQYIIDCGTIPVGARLYRDVTPGDTIRGTYMANSNRIYLTVLPDTVARYVINYNDLPADCATANTAEDAIIQELTRANRIKQTVKTRQR